MFPEFAKGRESGAESSSNQQSDVQTAQGDQFGSCLERTLLRVILVYKV